MKGESAEPTPYAVRCPAERALVYLTEEEYNRQMNQPDALWRCPRCGERAEWDDANYERRMGIS